MIVAAAGATLALVAALPLAPLVKVFAVLWIGCSALRAYRAVARVRGLYLSGRSIEVEDANGGWREGVIRDGSFVSPALTILRWRPCGALFDRTILVAPDMLGAEDFRALRVELKMA